MKIKASNGNVFHGLQSTILEQNWEPKHFQGPSHGNLEKYILYTGGFLLTLMVAYTGIKFLVKLIKIAYYSRSERAIITITPITPSAPASPITAEVPTRTSSTMQDLNRLNSRMESFAKYKANSINQVINLYELMGPNLEDTTQCILDDYLEETLEMDNIPGDMDLPFDEVNIQ